MRKLKPAAPSWHSAVWLMLVISTLGTTVSPGPALAQQLPPKITGTYTISLAGIRIGDFHITSALKDSRYLVNGDARLSAFLGALKWHGKAHAEGEAAGRSITPSGYRMSYEASRRKKGTLSMAYTNGTISRIDKEPPSHPAPDIIPVRREHLENVYDPLSAIIALAIADKAAPCDRRIGVFDGKLRFDLALTYHRQVTIKPTRNRSEPIRATVCRVRFIPVAGYRKSDDLRAMTEARGIEVWLREVPGAQVMLPHEIRVPTAAGHVVLNAKRIDILASDKRQIALVN